MSFFELAMILCFGISWPFNLANSIRMRSTKGKSLIFLVAIFVGYICGVIHKVVNAPGDPVLWAYVLNLCMVGADLVLYFINRAREKRVEAAKAGA